MLATLDARKSGDGRLAIAEHDLNVRPELAQKRAHNPFGLLEHRAQNVLRLDLLILIAFSEFNPRLNGFLPSKCQSV